MKELNMLLEFKCAVSTEYRNSGVFRKLSDFGLNWSLKIGASWVEHNVLVNNYPVNKSFSKAGFYINNSYVTLHKWL
jgi:hypothetical protein